MRGDRMMHLTTAGDVFHARVIAARLGSDGIVTELRGAVDGPWPVPGEVAVLVSEDDLPVAAELLLADEVEAVFEDADTADIRPLRYRVLCAWVPLVAVLVWTIATTVR